MSLSEPILCSNCQSNLDCLVAEVSREDLEYSEIMQRNRTNATPETLHEHSQMQASIDEANGTLEQCDQAIFNLEEQLARLRKARLDLIRTRIAPRQSLLSPIRKLPREILTLVFANVGHRIEFDSYQKMKFRGAVFGLTWVCTHWRAIALSESQMWSSFSMYFGDTKTEPSHELIAFTRECFEVRGKNALIKLSLSSLSDVSSAFSSMLYVMFQSTERWREAKFYFDDAVSRPLPEYLGKFSLVTGRLKFPRLESLTLDVDSDDARGSDVLSLVQDCPQLRHLTVPYLDASKTLIGMKNLTSVKVDEITGCLVQLLIQCPFLERLELLQSTADPVDDALTEDYCHTHLSDLDMFGLSPGWSTGLRLPALTCLSFCFNPSFDSEESISEMVDLLLRSRCSLQCINLPRRRPRIESVIDQFLNDILPVTAPDALVLMTL